MALISALSKKFCGGRSNTTVATCPSRETLTSFWLMRPSSSGEIWLSLLDERRDALSQVLGAEAFDEFFVGDMCRLRQRLEIALMDLLLHDAHRARRR